MLSNKKIIAKYKNKYYNCKILNNDKNKKESKVLIHSKNIITYIKNKDIIHK